MSGSCLKDGIRRVVKYGRSAGRPSRFSAFSAGSAVQIRLGCLADSFTEAQRHHAPKPINQDALRFYHRGAFQLQEKSFGGDAIPAAVAV